MIKFLWVLGGNGAAGNCLQQQEQKCKSVDEESVELIFNLRLPWGAAARD